jgi:hypothetical protein
LRAFSSLLSAFRPFIEANSASTEGWGEDGYEKIVRERWVIVCGWVGGGEAFVDLKELKASVAADLGGLRAFSSQLPALSFQLSASSSQLPASSL